MLTIRHAAPSDAWACHELDRVVWGSRDAATAKTFLARIAVYPQGNLVAIDTASGAIVGSIWTVASEERPGASWWSASGRGRYLGVCKPEAEALFGVSIAADPRHEAPVIKAALIARTIEIATAAGKHRLSFGSPIRDFHRWHRSFAVSDYVHLSQDGPWLYFQDPASQTVHRTGLAEVAGCRDLEPRLWAVVAQRPDAARPLDPSLAELCGITAASFCAQIESPVADYFCDPASLNFGVKVAWKF